MIKQIDCNKSCTANVFCYAIISDKYKMLKWSTVKEGIWRRGQNCREPIDSAPTVVVFSLLET